MLYFIFDLLWYSLFVSSTASNGNIINVVGGRTPATAAARERGKAAVVGGCQGDKTQLWALYLVSAVLGFVIVHDVDGFVRQRPRGGQGERIASTAGSTGTWGKLCLNGKGH